MAQPDARTRQAVDFAVVKLLQASREWTRAYDEWAHEPDDEHEVKLDAAERRLEEAQHEVAKREAIERLVKRSRDERAP